TESWLVVQTRPPVCVTRTIRTVSPEGVAWPPKPRILFISGDPDNVPFDDHRDALVDAIQPYRYPGRDDPLLSNDGAREQFGELRQRQYRYGDDSGRELCACAAPGRHSAGRRVAVSAEQRRFDSAWRCPLSRIAVGRTSAGACATLTGRTPRALHIHVARLGES